MRTIAWYSYIHKSGIDIKSIRIQYSTVRQSSNKPLKRHYGDRDRQWHRWSQGHGPVKPDVLEIVEKKIPGSMFIYLNGPEGSRLWHALKPDSQLNDEFMKYSQPGLHSTDQRLDSNEMMATPWHRISFRILTYRLRFENTLQPRLPGDHVLLGKTSRQSFETARKALLELLQIEKNILFEYSLYPQDILYLLDPGSVSKTGNIIQFAKREKHLAWL